MKLVEKIKQLKKIKPPFKKPRDKTNQIWRDFQFKLKKRALDKDSSRDTIKEAVSKIWKEIEENIRESDINKD
jgi:hypothetical protein